NLVRFGVRDCDASIGRWLSRDPILFRGGWNLYAYALGDPVNYNDPLGLAAAFFNMSGGPIPYKPEDDERAALALPSVLPVNADGVYSPYPTDSSRPPVPVKIPDGSMAIATPDGRLLVFAPGGGLLGYP